MAHCLVKKVVPSLPDNCRLPYYLVAQGRRPGRVQIDGRTMVDFASNDYLGLSTDQRVTRDAAAAVAKFGAGAGSAAILGGMVPLHVQLQNRLSTWMKQDSALLFPSGFQACMGTVSFLGERNIIVIDRDAHASLVEGARNARRGFRRFRTSDLSSLDTVLGSLPAEKSRVVVVDGVYSMTGRQAPLRQIYRLAQAHNATVVVDEAHSLGILAEGRGAVHAAELEGSDIIQVGTFSKALGSCGGFVAGSHAVIEALRSSCRHALFTAALSPSLCAAALRSLRIIQEEPERIRRVRSLADLMRAKLGDLGLTVGNEPGLTNSTIVPVQTSSSQDLFMTWERLYEAGFYASAVVPPACPRGVALLRFSCNWGHTEQDIDAAVSTLLESVPVGSEWCS